MEHQISPTTTEQSNNHKLKAKTIDYLILPLLLAEPTNDSVRKLALFGIFQNSKGFYPAHLEKEEINEIADRLDRRGKTELAREWRKFLTESND